MQFFLLRFSPTVMLVLMAGVYLACALYGKPPSVGLTAAMYAGLLFVGLVALSMKEFAGRNRMTNPIALWTLFFMAFAPMAAAAFETPKNGALAVLIIVMVFITAGAIAYLLERFIMNGECGQWYVEYGLAPFAVVWAAAGEIGGHHIEAGLALGFYWFAHFFFKQLPQLAESVGIKPRKNSG